MTKMAAIALLRNAALIRRPQFPPNFLPFDRSPALLPHFPLLQNLHFPFCPLRSNGLYPYFQHSCAGGDGGVGRRSGGSGVGGGGWSSGGQTQSGNGGGKFNRPSSSAWENLGILGLFIKGWKSRVSADPQFPFKVLMEELVGVSACVLGDMASRPNFGLNELDFVFSTLVVGLILNFVLMYLLAPTISPSPSTLPGIFATCPNGHMFEPGAYRLVDRLGTFVYKGALFAAVGFAAGLLGTAISNELIKLRKKVDPDFVTANKPPPTVLNSLTWALHMGVSSNLRYQTLNGIEFFLAKAVPPVVFKAMDVVLRCFNNVLGGASFVLLARLTGSQSATKAQPPSSNGEVAPAAAEKKLLSYSEQPPINRST